MMTRKSTREESPIALCQPPMDESRRSTASDALTAELADTARLAAGAAYELDPPLSRALASVRALALDAPEGMLNEHGALVREALSSMEQIEETVRGLRAFTSIAPEAHGLDVHEAIELALHFARQEVEPRAMLRRRYSPVPRAHGSTVRLAHALMSLLRNAAASIPGFLPQANTITIATGVTEDGRVAIDVIDTGVGIEPDDLPYVFDPFFTTKPNASAQGLGLATARAAVLEMGGTISAESTVGRGTCFRITLSSAAVTGEEDGFVLPLYENELRPARRILCVGATPEEASRVADLVEDRSARVLLATYEDALERLALGESFELILCEASIVAEDFRAELAQLAPEASSRTFAFARRERRYDVGPMDSGIDLTATARVRRVGPR